MLCSAYKFYGPHISFLYSRPGVLESLDPDRLVVQDQEAPYIIETGTLNHASCAGVSAAIDFISTLGEGESYRVKAGERIAQLLISPIPEVSFKAVSYTHLTLPTTPYV